MLGKFLITVGVVLAAFFVLRQRKLSTLPAPSKRPIASSTADTTKPSEEPSLSSDMRLGAYMFLVLMVGLAAVMYYFDWQDDHQVLKISLHRDNQTQPVLYEVYKFQLEKTSFVTIDGTLVTIASDERMEITGLEL